MNRLKLNFLIYRSYYFLFLAIIIFLSVNVNAGILPITKDKSQITKIWKHFREVFPFHTQCFAVSEPDNKDNCILIMSEPPPHVTISKIKNAIPYKNFFKNFKIYKHPIGYSGWLKDIVVQFKNDEKKLADAITSLNYLFYKTSYKSYILKIKKIKKVVSPFKYNLDLQITANQIEHWLTDKNENFISTTTGKHFSINEIISLQISSVFFTNNPGLVIWWIPKQLSFNKSVAQARRFALDSDIVIGALAYTKGVLVIARERVIPVDIFPPLRIETLSLLASVKSNQLYQSYERNFIIAGHCPFSNRDWAPIDLSPELVDTEYGSLLNIADQLLKSWSNNGQTVYENFNYSPPKKWPFKNPLPIEINADEVTYNWNTKGLGHTIIQDNKTIYALKRTGSLPISYIPGESSGSRYIKQREAEKRGYNYFAKISDPNLARVVQYTAFYQIFHNFKVLNPKLEIKDTINNIRSSIFQPQIFKYLKELKSINSYETPIIYLKEKDDKYLFEIAIRLSRPRSHFDSGESLWIRDLTPIFRNYALQKGINYKNYSKKVISSKKLNWIHTPVVVLSQNIRLLGDKTGGHNINSTVQSFKLDNDVQTCEIRYINEQMVINVNPIYEFAINEITTIVEQSNTNNLEKIETEISNYLSSIVSDEFDMKNDFDSMNMTYEEALYDNTEPKSSDIGVRGLNFSSNNDVGYFVNNPSYIPAYNNDRKVDTAIIDRDFDNNTIAIKLVDNDTIIEEFTVDNNNAELSEFLINLLNNQSINIQEFQIQASNNFNYNEIEAIKTNIQINAEYRKIIAVLKKDIKDDKDIKTILNDRYDFSKITIQDTIIDDKTLNFLITIPLKTKPENHASLLDSTMYLSENTPKNILMKIINRCKIKIKSIFNVNKYFNYTKIQDLLDEMKDELKKIALDSGQDVKSIENKLKHNLGDIYIIKFYNDQNKHFFFTFHYQH